MRIAHCIHGLGSGGAQKVIATLLHQRQDPSLRHFVYSCHDGVERRAIEAAASAVRILPRTLAKLDPIWVWRLARAMRRDAIALVHTHLFGDSLHGYLAARLSGNRPVVMTLHTRPEGLSGLQRRGYGGLLRRCARAVACSQAVARAFEQAYGESGLPHPILTIANGLTPPDDGLSPEQQKVLRASLGYGPETLLLGAIGRLAVEKGFDDLLTALADLRSIVPEVRLLLVGDGPLRHALEQRAEALGLGETVHFTGFRTDVAQLLGIIDVVVFSSLWEGLPVALLEAMATRRCIVTTDVPGILEAVRDGRE
ncbi:MAG: glycosyltransferase, partial [Acidobacteriota bacterium]